MSARISAYYQFSDAVEYSRCPSCASERIVRHFIGHDFQLANEGDFRTDRCESCQLIFMNPMPSVTELKRFYPQNYYSFEEPSLPSGLRYRLRRLLGMQKKTLLPEFARPGTMLDIGCGAGQYLTEMRAKGWKVYGSELSALAAAAGQRTGLDIRPGELIEAGFDPAMFDFIRSNHSFEHIPNSAEVLREIHRILKPDGKLFLGLPNVASAWARLFGKYWWNFGLPVHTYNFSPRSIRVLLEANGFKVERIRYYSDYSGLTGSAQIYLNRNLRPRRSSGRLLSNWVLRVPAHYLCRLFDLLHVGDCMEVIAVKSSGTPARTSS
jgi:SAM-dependent methyltransferase